MGAVTARSILLRIALVIAVVAGLVAMHTLVAGQPQTVAPLIGSVEHAPAAVGDPETPAGADDCGAPCIPPHAMELMTCVLALLAGLAVLAATPRAGSGQLRPHATVASPAAALRSVVPRAPSLIALSISRT